MKAERAGGLRVSDALELNAGAARKWSATRG
jgi:hypothetical protein